MSDDRPTPDGPTISEERLRVLAGQADDATAVYEQLGARDPSMMVRLAELHELLRVYRAAQRAEPQPAPATGVAARCTRCGVEFTEAQLAGVKCCPACGSRGVPCDPANDVSVRINWHELRILCIWAENWAHRCDTHNEDEHEPMVPVMHVIAARLQRQHEGKPPLTLSGEIQELRDAGYNVETYNIPEGEKSDG